MVKRIAGIAVAVFVLASCVVYAQDEYPKHSPETLPGVEPRMLTADYWIALQNNPDEVVMTADQIQEFNRKVREKRVVLSEKFGKANPLEREFVITEIKGPVMNPLQPLEMPATLPGDSLRVRLRSNVDWLYSRDFVDGRNATWSDTMKKDLVADMNIDAVPVEITRRFGIVVHHALVRHYPTEVPGYSNAKWEMDMFQATGLMVGNPVAVLHTSVNGDYLYIESPISRGWVKASDIAFGSRRNIAKLTGDDKFLMVTSHCVPVYTDRDFNVFDRYVYMSGTLPLARQRKDAWEVKLPVRRPDGSVDTVKGYIKPDADVHVGYLPYTKRNVLTQIFKLIDQPYGWADQDNKRDCSGTQRILLRCFGIITGRHPSFILSASDHQTFIDRDWSTEEKTKKVAALEPVITLAGNSGHIVMLLGKAQNGKLYYIHQAGWGYKDESGEYLTVNRVSVNAADHSWYSINSPGVYTTFRP